jgi:hypothetical protein
MGAFLPTTTTTTPLPLLTSLTISRMHKVGDDFMVPFIAAHPRLESMVLEGCRIGDATLYAIASHLSRLHHLEIQQEPGLSIEVIKRVVHHCPVLDKVLYTRTAARRRLSNNPHLIQRPRRYAIGWDAQYDDGDNDVNGVVIKSWVSFVTQCNKSSCSKKGESLK